MSIHQIICSNSTTKVLQDPYFNKEIVDSKLLGSEMGMMLKPTIITATEVSVEESPYNETLLKTRNIKLKRLAF